ncbi:hypothetical protein J1765_gp79 [Gordonia phage Gaea]|nr:hypothetical protein J1762_gp76 [Gordonia phage JKSyngboy]YP_010001957.1 hypothetical protein J1765_gp79 [Gordonia phage Gaea]YP_010002043.1 hypothetical protein J1766_gp79 [Gordonia phage Bizzy]URP21145.1 hypothetical protein SEA_FLATWOODS_78 [Gordonia phage Flatwoods]UTN91733.1 DNA binding protein [Gordonia Phage StorminNorm]WMI33086.1 hypothetical protein SEA_SCHOTTB_76 [Gordonia Phage SchottB]AYR02714.1 hypothetical protein SEA_BIZZY_79 [Gordonia phage Bizzy]AYR02887.1 hypothetical pr
MSRRRPPVGPACSAGCGQPVLAAAGGRHLSCSPVCTDCHLPIPGDDPLADGPAHGACHDKKRRRR